MSIYAELADHIDDVYGSRMWKHTEDRAFVKIFRTLLTEEEAYLALHMKDTCGTASELAQLVNRTTEQTNKLLEKLAVKGIAFVQDTDGTACYRLLPYMPGIVDALVSGDMSEEIAGYINDYMKEVDDYKRTLQAHTIPLNFKIETKTYHITREEVRLYLDQAQFYSVSDCICRQVNEKNGKGCGHPIKDMCIQIGNYARYYVDTGRARRISREEAEEIILQAEEEGLYHEIYPIDDSKENAFICNCCDCGCLFMRLSGRIHNVIATEIRMKVLPELCDGCGACIRECPEQAFRLDEGGEKAVFDSEACFACGICKLVCEQDAIVEVL